MDDTYPIIGLILILLLLIVKALISHSKSAISNINEVNIRKAAEENEDKRAILLVELSEKPPSYIYAIDIIITTISILIGYIYHYMIFKSFDNFLLNTIGNEIIVNIIHILIILILVVIVAFAGSLIPKKIGFYKSDEKAYKSIMIMMFVMKLLRPITVILQYLIDGFVKIIGLSPKDLVENVTEEEIISMVNEGHEQGVLEENEVKMISKIIEFDEKEVADIMTHRNSIIAVDCSMELEKAYEFMLSKNNSRFPLYEGELDNIVGILHFKDVARAYISDKDKNKSLLEISRKPYFVPDTQSIDSLLNDMQANKLHMVIAVDEYGQTSGLVAFEDILEEIVGNILDEYDEEEKNIVKQANGNFIIKGLTPLEEINEALGIEMNNDIYETLNGFLISKLQRIPNDGEKCNVSFEGYIFEILDVRNKIINFVRARKIK